MGSPLTDGKVPCLLRYDWSRPIIAESGRGKGLGRSENRNKEILELKLISRSHRKKGERETTVTASQTTRLFPLAPPLPIFWASSHVGFRPSSPFILSRSARWLSLAIYLIFVFVRSHTRLQVKEDDVDSPGTCFTGPLSSQGLTNRIGKFETTGTLRIQPGRERRYVAAQVVDDIATQGEEDRSQTIGSTSAWRTAGTISQPRSTVVRISTPSLEMWEKGKLD
ncbi:hypothetical protein TNCV_153971 [Trichonephila clavipes]|nr:hypothetical protein TNCV_153971 [Trichonephila clavipes]